MSFILLHQGIISSIVHDVNMIACLIHLRSENAKFTIIVHWK